MSLDLKDMEYLCALAKIAPKKQDLSIYAGQCAKIIDYFNELDALDTSAVEPLYNPCEHTILFREDEVFQKRTRDEILQNAPQTDDVYFIVPKIVEGK